MSGTVLFLEPKGTAFEVVRTAKARGYDVVAISSDISLIEQTSEPYNTAVPLLNSIIKIDSWNDYEAIVELVKNIADIKGIYYGMDPCSVVGAKLRELFHLPTPKPQALNIVLNKYEVRKRLRELGLSNLKNYHSSAVNSWGTWKPGRPMYFKPVHGFFSAYVQKCTSLNEVQDAKDALQRGLIDDRPVVRNYLASIPEYHLEEAFEGELLSVEAISQGGEFHVLGLLSRILYSKNPIVEMGSCFPYPHPLSARIIEKVRQAHAELGLTDGPTHTEVIVSDLGEIEIIDLNPRFVGADVLQSINFAYNIKIEEALLDYATGKQIVFDLNQPRYSCLQYVLPPEVSAFESIDFPREPEVKFHTSFLKPGMEIRSKDKQLDYLGCYLTVMPEFSTALKRSRELRSAVRVNHKYKGVY